MWSADSSNTSKKKIKNKNNTCCYLCTSTSNTGNILGLVCFKVGVMLSRFSFHHRPQWRPMAIWAQAHAWAQHRPEGDLWSSISSPQSCEPNAHILTLVTDAGVIIQHDWSNRKDECLINQSFRLPSVSILCFFENSRI